MVISRSSCIAALVVGCTSPPKALPVRGNPPLVTVPPVAALPPSATVAAAPSAAATPSQPPPIESIPCEPLRGRATCAGGKRCPANAPICAVTAVGATCVACGTAEHAAVKSDQRWGCTRQSDCDGADGCFFVVGESDFGLRTLCREPDPGGANPGVCDLKKDVCNGKDPSCLPCRPLDGDIAVKLPWVGTW